MKISFLGPVSRPPEEQVAKVASHFVAGTVRDLLEQLGFPAQQVSFLSVIRDNQRLSLDQELMPDDTITVMLVVGGG
jgi:sulfur carrier protein ThiS